VSYLHNTAYFLLVNSFLALSWRLVINGEMRQ